MDAEKFNQMDADNSEAPVFNSNEEELRYWRQEVAEYRTRLKESQQEQEEYQAHSGELEAELEAELEQSQGRCSELRHQVVKLASENEEIKDRLRLQSVTVTSRVDALEEELQEVRAIKDELSTYIRQLEQANDDLERAKRATLTSLEDFEGRLNQAIERNAFLESELDEKESLKEMVQRLKDESRDLRQEVSVRHIRAVESPRLLLFHDNDRAAAAAASLRHGVGGGAVPISGGGGGLSPEPLMGNYHGVDSNKLASENLGLSGGVGDVDVTLTPSARISALNIVADLLRKVGALESRLASCRTLVKDNQRPLGTPSAIHPPVSGDYMSYKHA